MRDHEPTNSRVARDGSGARVPATGLTAAVGESVHLRSYDHRWGYDLDVEVRDADGEPVFRDRYYLLPGHATSETLEVPPGTYEVQVTLDNRTERRRECRIDATPDHTAVIEVGNGIVSLTEGLQG